MRIDSKDIKCDKCGSTEVDIYSFPKQKRSEFGYKTYYTSYIVVTCTKCGNNIDLRRLNKNGR